MLCYHLWHAVLPPFFAQMFAGFSLWHFEESWHQLCLGAWVDVEDDPLEPWRGQTSRVEEDAVKLHVCRGCIGVQMSQFPFNQGAERGNRLSLKFAHPQDVKGMRDCPCRGQVEFAWGVIHPKKWRIVAQLLVSLVLYFPRLRAKPDNLKYISCQRCPFVACPQASLGRASEALRCE